MYTRKERDNIAAIRKKILFLKQKSDNQPTLMWFRREVRALEWALREIEKARGELPAIESQTEPCFEGE